MSLESFAAFGTLTVDEWHGSGRELAGVTVTQFASAHHYTLSCIHPVLRLGRRQTFRPQAGLVRAPPADCFLPADGACFVLGCDRLLFVFVSRAAALRAWNPRRDAMAHHHIAATCLTAFAALEFFSRTGNDKVFSVARNHARRSRVAVFARLHSLSPC